MPHSVRLSFCVPEARRRALAPTAFRYLYISACTWPIGFGFGPGGVEGSLGATSMPMVEGMGTGRWGACIAPDPDTFS